MEGGGGSAGWAIVAVAGFALLVALVVWVAFRQRRSLDAWLDARVREDGWIAEPQEAPPALGASRWLRVLSSVGFGPLGGSNRIGVDRLCVNPRPAPIEAAGVLARMGAAAGWRMGPRSRWPRQQGGVALVARLPRGVSPPLVLIPQPAAGPPIWQWATGLDLPKVTVDDPRLNESWTVLSDDAAGAATTLEREPRLREALAGVAALAFRGVPRVNFPVIELTGERVLLFGGPKSVGQQPFAALEEAASTIAAALG